MKKKILLRVSLICLALVTLFCFVGCSSAAVRSSENANEVVATAGELEILYDEYYYLAMTRLQQLKAEYGEDAMTNPEVREKLTTFLAENLRTESHALLAIGLSLGIDVNEGDIADNVEAHMADILEETFGGDRDKYIESLAQGYLTDRYIRTFVAVENYLSVEIIKELLENGTLDDSDQAALEFLNGEDVVRVHSVVINEILDAKGNVIRSMEDAKKKAEDLRAAFVDAGTESARDAAFMAAMGESSDFSDTTGDGLYYARGELTKEYTDMVFSIPLYGASEVFEVEDGYCFLMRLPKDQAYIQKNLEDLKGKTYYVVLNQMLEEWLEENPLVMTAFGESLDPMALEVIEPDGGEGWITWLPILVIAVVVVAAVIVIVVLVFASRVKRGLPARRVKKGAKR